MAVRVHPEGLTGMSLCRAFCMILVEVFLLYTVASTVTSFVVVMVFVVSLNLSDLNVNVCVMGIDCEVW